MTQFLDILAIQPIPHGRAQKSQLLQRIDTAIPGSLAYLHTERHIQLQLCTEHTPTLPG